MSWRGSWLKLNLPECNLVPAIYDTTYASPSGMSLGFDFYRPDVVGPVPMVICIHGGGWISGDKSDMSEVAIGLASHGFAAACPSYRLAPHHPYPAPLDDLRSFVAYCREHAHDLGIQPDRIASLGNSAGGHLAAMVGLTGEERVNAVVDICGISDLSDPRADHFPISWAFLDQFMQVPYEGHEALYRDASPVCHVTKDAPPFLIIHGEADDIVSTEQSMRLASSLSNAGVEHELHLLPNEGHGFSYHGWAEIERHFLRFLHERLK